MKSILSKIKNLGSYARKTALSTAVGMGVFLGALGVSNEAKAIIENDTIFAQGLFKTRNAETSSPIPYVDISVRPIAMETILPDTTYNFSTSDAASYLFSQTNTPPNGLPVFIDIHEGVDETVKNSTRIITTPNGDANVFFKGQSSGVIEKYSSNGVLLGRKEFSGNSAFLPNQHEANGAYILRVIDENGKSMSHKFIKSRDSPASPLLRPDMDFKNVSDVSATYRVSWDHPGFIPDSVDLEIGESYANYFLELTPIPPLTQDWRFTVFNLNGEPLENALVYTELDGVIDSVRTDANGNAFLADRTLGTTYKLGIGGLENYKAWESNQYYDLEWSVPDEITNPADTLYQTTVILYPDRVVANGEEVDLFASDITPIFGNYNIMASLYDHVNQYYKTNTGDDFSPTQMETLMQWQEEFTALTGIPFVNKETPFDLENVMLDFNPYTVDENIVGTNHELGNNLTLGSAYFDMPNFAYESVIVAAGLVTLSCSDRAGTFKEWLRTLGYLQGGDGQMAGDPQPMTNQEAGQFGTNYLLGKARFLEGRHTFEPLHAVQYLKNDLEFSSKSAHTGIKMYSESNSTQFISGKR
jgi:hypothetical protein